MADDFAPKTNESNAPSFLNYSRGVDNNTLRTLFQGIGEAVDSGIKAVDRGFTQMVKDEVRASVEQTDASMGIVSNPRASGFDPMPEELANDINKLKTRRESMLAGRLSSEHYYAQLHAQSKKIRHRWGGADGASGYTEQIDDAFKELIGTTPANALRREMFAAQESAAREAAANRNSDQNFIDQIIKNGSVPPAFVDTIAVPGNVDNPEYMYALKSSVAAREAERNMYEVSSLKFENELKRGNVNKEALGSHYAKGLAMKVDDLVSRGVNYQRLQTMAAAAQKAALEGKSITPEAKQQIQALTGVVLNEVETIIAKERSTFNGFEHIRDDAGKIEDLIRNPVKQIAQGFADENYGVLKSGALNLKILRDDAEFNLLSSSKRVQTQDAARRIYGDVAFGMLIQDVGVKEFFSPTTEFYTNAALADATLREGKDLNANITDLVSEIKRNPETAPEAGKAVNTILSKIPGIIRNEDIDENMRLEMARKAYHPNNKALWSNLAADKRAKVYRDLVNPENYNAVKKLAMRDPSLLTNYETTVIDFAYSTSREPINTLNSVSTSISDKIVRYDEANNQVVVDTVTPPAVGGSLSTFTQTAINRVNSTGVSSAQDDVNMLLKSFEPIWTAKGIPKEKWPLEARAILRTFGLTLDKTGSNLFENIIGVQPQQPSRLGGPTSEDFSTLSSDIDLQQGRQISAAAGTNVEVKELMDNFNSTEDPELRALFKQQLFNLLSIDPSTLGTTPAPVGRGGDRMNMGSPITNPAIANNPAVKEVVDLLTGVPSFIEAIKSGDPTEIALAVASVIPFPGAKVAKGAKKAGEVVGEVLDPIVLEARRVAKEAADARKPGAKRAWAEDKDVLGEWERDVRNVAEEDRIRLQEEALKKMEETGNLRRRTIKRAESLEVDDLLKYNNKDVQLVGGSQLGDIDIPKASKDKKDWTKAEQNGVEYIKERLAIMYRSKEAFEEATKSTAPKKILDDISKMEKFLRKLDLKVVSKND